MVNDGVPTTNVVEYLNVSMTTIKRYLRMAWDVERLSGSGRPKITTHIEDRIVLELARQNLRITAAEVFRIINKVLFLQFQNNLHLWRIEMVH